MATISIKKYSFFSILLAILIAVVLHGVLANRSKHSRVMVLSVSTNGRYAISTSLNKKAILWNLQTKSSKVVDNHANIYSAYFIKNTDDYMWQNDKTNIVYVKNTSGKTIKKIKLSFPSYGEVMTSNLKTIIASDVNWNVYIIRDAHKKLIMKDNGGFYAGKLLNLNLSANDRYFITSGESGNDNYYRLVKGKNAVMGNFNSLQGVSKIDGVVLWNVKTGQPIRKFPGNEVKTYATFSPQGKYVLSGDENTFAFVWNINGKKHVSIRDVDYVPSLDMPVQPPSNYAQVLEYYVHPWELLLPEDHSLAVVGILTIKFIDKTHYLRFIKDSPFVLLYQINQPYPEKFIELNHSPYPSVDEYVFDQSIDTSWQSHLLVTGQYNRSGINVYHYNPKTKALKRTWVASAPWF